MDYSHIRELNRDRTREKHPRWRTDRSEYSEYHAQVYSLTRRTYKNNKEVLNPLDLPFGRCGVDGAYQLDHKISIKRGYELGLSAESLAGVDNLQVLPWKENRTKWFYDLSEDHK
jgi:5-methylcytosine-specific restriction endonuclease McrA